MLKLSSVLILSHLLVLGTSFDVFPDEFVSMERKDATWKDMLLVYNDKTSSMEEQSKDYGFEGGSERSLKLTAGYDCWYTKWEVYVPDPEYTEFHDYKIDPTLISGLFVSASTAERGSGSWDFMISAYGDYLREKQEDEAGEKAEYLRALISYGITEEKQLLTQFQSGKFEGELIGQYKFETDWIKMEVLQMSSSKNKDYYWTGWGLRYTRYSMPLEFTHYEKIGEEQYEDIGHEVIQVKTTGISVVLKSLDPMIFGYDNSKWYFLDGDVAFGISFAEAEEFVDKVYGFQFNSEINAGFKHVFGIGKGFIGLKAGYRVFFDGQILSEWKDTDDQSTSSTIRNYFHGPFVTVIGSF